MKYTIVILLSFAVISCGRKKVQLKANPEQYALTHPEGDSVKKKLSESYAGSIPCADCEGIKTIIKFYGDNTYLTEDTYLGKGEGKPFRSEGHYRTERGFRKDKDATLFILNDDNPTDKRYYVRYTAKPNRLYILDKDSKPLDSEQNYVLKRIE